LDPISASAHNSTIQVLRRSSTGISSIQQTMSKSSGAAAAVAVERGTCGTEVVPPRLVRNLNVRGPLMSRAGNVLTTKLHPRLERQSILGLKV
jgi:hypothetical protein